MHFNRHYRAIRTMMAILFCATLLMHTVVAAPMPLDVFSSAGHWLVNPSEWPLVESSAPSDAWSKIRKFLRILDVSITHSRRGMKILNRGSTPYMLQLGSKDKIFLIAPGTSETFPEAEQEELRKVALSRLPSDRKIKYNK